MPPVGFEPTISAGEQPQTYALDLAALGTGLGLFVLALNPFTCYQALLLPCRNKCEKHVVVVNSIPPTLSN